MGLKPTEKNPLKGRRQKAYNEKKWQAHREKMETYSWQRNDRRIRVPKKGVPKKMDMGCVVQEIMSCGRFGK